MMFNTENLLGKNSYPAIAKDIYQKIQSTTCSTLEGSELCNNIYQKLNESTTPMLDIKEFVTGAEALSKSDLTLKELLDFIKKRSTNGDLNYIINLCKEEHFKKLRALNHPAPEQTIKELEKAFGEPASVVEQGIKKGLFDALQSNLLNEVKKGLDVKPKNLNENNTAISSRVFNGNLVKYSPVGIKYEDLKNNQVVYLMESEILGLKRDTKELVALSESEVMIPEGYKLLIDAVNSCAFNPETLEFSLNENWDFDLKINDKGQTMVNGKQIPKQKIKDLLFESIQVYEKNPIKVQGFNKQAYIKDADKFIMLAENANKLIQFDNLIAIKNLSESTYVIFDKDGISLNQPKILASNVAKNKLFENFSDLVVESNNILKSEITPLFESQLINEREIYATRNQKIVELNESQKEINKAIAKVKNLKNMAEENSAALDELNSQETKLLQKLNENMDELNFYVNEFKPY